MPHNRTVAQPNGAKPMPAPDPEVRAAPRRRTFSAEYKLSILTEAERCCEPGAIGALLRREGLYSSHLTERRRQRASGELQGKGLYQQKCAALFEHVYESYPERSAGVYAVAA